MAHKMEGNNSKISVGSERGVIFIGEKGAQGIKQDIPYLSPIVIRGHDSNVFREHFQPKHQNHDLQGQSPTIPQENSRTTHHQTVNNQNVRI